jgi:hypothetical protein
VVDVNVASRACGAPALDPTRRTRKDHTTEGLRAILQKRLDTTLSISRGGSSELCFRFAPHTLEGREKVSMLRS